MSDVDVSTSVMGVGIPVNLGMVVYDSFKFTSLGLEIYAI
jgi:hypothetical protein